MDPEWVIVQDMDPQYAALDPRQVTMNDLDPRTNMDEVPPPPPEGPSPSHRWDMVRGLPPPPAGPSPSYRPEKRRRVDEAEIRGRWNQVGTILNDETVAMIATFKYDHQQPDGIWREPVNIQLGRTRLCSHTLQVLHRWVQYANGPRHGTWLVDHDTRKIWIKFSYTGLEERAYYHAMDMQQFHALDRDGAQVMRFCLHGTKHESSMPGFHDIWMTRPEVMVLTQVV
jgi:hypothetical protein